MKKGIFYTIFILLLFLPMYWLNKEAFIRHQWVPTFDTKDKEPFGAYAFDKILNDSWPEEYLHNYLSFYALAPSDNQYLSEETGEDYDNDYDTVGIPPYYNLLVIANYLYLDSVETKILLNYVEKGGSAILATNDISGALQDSLNISINHSFLYEDLINLSVKQTEENIRFCASDSGEIVLTLPQPLVKNYFEIPDTVNYTYFDSLYRISTVSDEKTISLRYAIGEGNLIIIANPLLFTNYGILNDSINPYIWKHLAYLEGKPLMRTEYYEKGSQGGKSQSEFRVILRERAFRWAYYTILAGLLVFMIFTAKRKQKIIPVIRPPANKMLDFVRSIAGLYLLKNNNADILLKKQIYWGEDLKRKYGIDIVNERRDYDFYNRVATKTGQPFDEIRRLFIDLEVINESTFVPDYEMMRLVAKMNKI
ncbi:MAG: hypothetical protein FWF53_03145 [Candidatus Azobacteroides sp.]|nr:hypothetical protein [Candidatus Azobacteroides sp.]